MRRRFGGDLQGWVFTVGSSESDNVLHLTPGATVTFWSAQEGGVQYTDLLAADGATPIDHVIALSGEQSGRIPVLYGPDANPQVAAMWASSNGGPRSILAANDTAELGVVNDATGSANGLVRLAGALTGTAAAPALADGAVTATKIAAGIITNAHLAGGAAIDQTKIAGLASTLAGKADLVGGKVAAAQLPSLAVVDFLGSVASQAAMLALTGQQGDWCARSDLGTTWILKGTDPTQLASWQELAYPAAADATTGTKGAVKLAGDLSGTAAAPTVAAGAITASKLAAGAVTDAAVSASAAIAASKIAGTALTASGNLAGLAAPGTARGNLGLGTAATLNVGTVTGTVAAGDDGRFTDARAPLAHATSHYAGGTDAISIAQAQVVGLASTLSGKADLVSGQISPSQLPDLTVADGTITDVKVATGAAIAQSKIAGLVTALAGKIAKGESYLSVADYGVVGTADDMATFQAAIDAAATYGTRVFVPPGTYTVGLNGTTLSCLRLKPGLKGFFGAGMYATTIKVKAGVGEYHSVISNYSSASGQGAVADAIAGLELHGFTIDQNNTGNPVANPAASGPLFAGLKPRFCIGVAGGSGSSQVQIRNVRCIDTDGVNTVFFQGRDITIEGCEFVVSDTGSDHDHSAIYTSNQNGVGGHCRIEGNIIRANTAGNITARTAIETHGGSQHVYANTVRNYFKGGNLTGVSISAGDGIQWIANSFVNVRYGIQLWSLVTPAYIGLRGCRIAFNQFVMDPVSWTPTGATDCRAIFLDTTGVDAAHGIYPQPFIDVYIEHNDIRYPAPGPGSPTGHVGDVNDSINHAIDWRRTSAPSSGNDRNIQIRFNHIDMPIGSGIRYTSVAGDVIDGLIIEGNRIRNAGQGTAPAGGALNAGLANGLMIIGAVKNGRIENNDLVDDQAAHTMKVGLYLAPTVSGGSNNLVRGNRVVGQLGAAYLFNAAIDGGWLVDADVPTWVAPTGLVALGSQFRALDTGVMYRQTASPNGSTWASYTPGAGGSPIVTTFTATGTWTKPAGAVKVDVICIAGGGGGGSGRRGAAGGIRCGGGGGGGGGITQVSLPASALTSTVTVTVGTGGAGGASVTTASTNGNAGVAGGNTTFGTYVRASGGTAGSGGTPTAGTGGSGNTGTSLGGNGASASGTGAAGGAAGITAGPPGGGAGGGITAANAASAGGASVASFAAPAGGTSGSAGAVDAATPTAGGSVTAGLALPGGGGGGGAASLTTNAQAGAAGGLYGAGGGGGGASLDPGGTPAGGNSGAGGNGGDGICMVVTYF